MAMTTQSAVSALGKHLSEAWSAEVLLNGTKLQGDPDGCSRLTSRSWGGSVDLLRVFNRSGGSLLTSAWAQARSSTT